MHARNPETSGPLIKTLEVLSDGREHTTRQIRLVTRSEAVHSDIAELRERLGEGIIPRARRERQPDGKQIAYYRMVRSEA